MEWVLVTQLGVLKRAGFIAITMTFQFNSQTVQQSYIPLQK
jgi:hypothetical protein